MDLPEIIRGLQSLRVKRRHYIWEPFMRKYGLNVICEIGGQVGENFADFIRHNPTLAVAVDSWIDDGVISRNDGGYSQKVLNQQYEYFKNMVSDKPFVKIYREYSFDAVKHFEDNYFDLVYIDADHTYEGCLRDITDWYPKVKKSGFLLGDDYRIYRAKHTGVRFGVIEAVNEFTRLHNLDFITLPKHGWGIIKMQ